MMNAYGIALMALSCGFVIALNVYCFQMVFRKRERKGHK